MATSISYNWKVEMIDPLFKTMLISYTPDDLVSYKAYSLNVPLPQKAETLVSIVKRHAPTSFWFPEETAVVQVGQSGTQTTSNTTKKGDDSVVWNETTLKALIYQVLDDVAAGKSRT